MVVLTADEPKAKQKVARKLLLKYKLQLEEHEEKTAEGDVHNYEIMEKVNFLVTELTELKTTVRSNANVLQRDPTRAPTLAARKVARGAGPTGPGGSSAR